MISALLLAAIVATVAGLGVAGLRIELVARIRKEALELVYARIQSLLFEAGENVDGTAVEELEAAIEAQWAIFDKHNHDTMLIALTKWSFAHFFPELVEDRAAAKAGSTLE